MSYFGLHLQTPIDDWDKEVARAANAGKPYRIIKTFWIEAGQTIKSISPNTITVFRHNVEHKQPFLDRAGVSALEADSAADEFILKFKDSLNQHGHVDYTESLNETYASKDLEGQRKSVAFDRAFIRRLRVHCPNTRPVVYTAASGNIDHDEYAILVDLARECQAAGGAFGYHNYWSVVNKKSYVNSSAHARDYHMRWAYSLDSYLSLRGIRVNYMLGESGPIGAQANGYWQKPDDGWLKNDVWNGDMNGYLSDLSAMDVLFNSSIPGRTGRLLGVTLFTSGRAIGWQHFLIQKPFLTKLTDYVMGSVVIPTPPPTNPEPLPPISDFEERAWNLTTEMQETGQNGIRLNKDAAIQDKINQHNAQGNYELQIVTSERVLDGKTIQAVESRTGAIPRRVYVWEAGKPVTWFEHG